MSKEVSNTPDFGVPMDISALETGLAETRAEANVSDTSGLPYLRLQKDGDFVFGSDDDEVADNDQWAINPYSITKGAVAWGDESNKLGEVMVPFNQPLPDFSALPDVGAEWKHQVGYQLQCIKGDNEGVAVQYNTTSLGGRKAHKKMIDAILAQIKVDKTAPVPVVVLEADSYKHKKYGKIYTPIFKITGFIDMDGLIVSDEDEPEEEVKPKTRTRATAK